MYINDNNDNIKLILVVLKRAVGDGAIRLKHEVKNKPINYVNTVSTEKHS